MGGMLPGSTGMSLRGCNSLEHGMSVIPRVSVTVASFLPFIISHHFLSPFLSHFPFLPLLEDQNANALFNRGVSKGLKSTSSFCIQL